MIINPINVKEEGGMKYLNLKSTLTIQIVIILNINQKTIQIKQTNSLVLFLKTTITE